MQAEVCSAEQAQEQQVASEEEPNNQREVASSELAHSLRHPASANLGQAHSEGHNPSSQLKVKVLAQVREVHSASHRMLVEVDSLEVALKLPKASAAVALAEEVVSVKEPPEE